MELDVILEFKSWLVALVEELPDLVVCVTTEFEVRLPEGDDALDGLAVLEGDCVE